MAWVMCWLRAAFSVLLISIMMSAGLTSNALAQADVGLSTLFESIDPVPGLTDYSYHIQLFNYGDKPAEDTQVTLPIPSSLKFISVSPAKQCRYVGEQKIVQCDFGTLKAQNDKGTDIEVVVRPAGVEARSVILVARASSSSVELITNNNQQSETTTFAGGPSNGRDIGISRFEEIPGLVGDKARSFEIVIKNFGAAQARDGKLVVTVPSLLEYHSASPVENCKFDSESGQLTCELAALEPIEKGGDEAVVQVSLTDSSNSLGAVTIKAAVIASGLTSNGDEVVANEIEELIVTLGAQGPKPVAVAQADGQDEAPENTAAIEEGNTADSATPAQSSGGGSNSGSSGGSSSSASGSAKTGSGSTGGSGGLFSGISNFFNGKTSGPSGGDVDFQIQSFETDPDEVPAGATFTLNTELTNNGPGVANNAQLDVTVPEGVAFVSGPAACAHDGNPPSGASQVHCSFGNIANAGTQSVPIIFRAVIPGRVVRTFSATIDSASNETNAANNSQNVNFTIANGDDLLLAIDGLPNPAVAGGNVTYGLTVTNQGLNIAEGASVTFNLPPGITYVGAGSGGSGWSCSAAGQVVTCSSGANIAATNGTVSFSIVGNIGIGSGTYTASSTVYSAITPDVDGANDTTTFDLTVSPGTDLSVAKSVSQDPMYGGSTPTFTITVTNNGPISASNLVLTDTLPADFGYVSAIGAGWTCGNAGQLVTCTRRKPCGWFIRCGHHGQRPGQ